MQARALRPTPERLPVERGIHGTDGTGRQTRQMIDGRYRLERALDRKARVWLASDRAGDQHVLKTGTADSVRREFETLVTLRHPNIVAVKELIASGNQSYLVLEYLTGGDLVGLAGFEPKHWLGPLGDVIEALAFAHRHGIAHRDLKARNVLLDDTNRARLTDFESARPIGSRFSPGGTTAAAVEPDRPDGPVAAADDVYALACLVHELLFGLPPRSGRPQPAPDRAGDLARLVGGCLETSDIAARPDLQDFRAVVKLHQRLSPDHE
jgi:serine/threonine protein kinase